MTLPSTNKLCYSVVPDLLTETDGGDGPAKGKEDKNVWGLGVAS